MRKHGVFIWGQKRRVRDLPPRPLLYDCPLSSNGNAGMAENDYSALRQQSRLPLSLKVKYTLRARLERGEWPVGFRIPTLEELVAEYGVSRATVRAALDELEQEGLIERTRGKGTFVIRDVRNDQWLMLPTDWASLISHIENLNVEFDVLEAGHGALPAEFVVDAVADDKYWWETRVNRTKSVPYSLNTVYVTNRLTKGRLRAFRSEPVLPVLNRHCRDELHTAYQTLMIKMADASIARPLGIEIGMPVARVVRVAKNVHNVVVYAARVFYPANYLFIRNDFQPLGPT